MSAAIVAISALLVAAIAVGAYFARAEWQLRRVGRIYVEMPVYDRTVHLEVEWAPHTRKAWEVGYGQDQVLYDLSIARAAGGYYHGTLGGAMAEARRLMEREARRLALEEIGRRRATPPIGRWREGKD